MRTKKLLLADLAELPESRGWLLETAALAALLTIAAVNWYWSTHEDGHLADFASFLASSRLASAGENPYADSPLVPSWTESGRRYYATNLNPPAFVLLFTPATWIDPYLAFRLWYLATLVIYPAVLWWLFRQKVAGAPRLRLAWCLAFAGFWYNLDLGQIYVALFALSVTAMALLSRGRSVEAGLLIGIIVALKPNFAVWPALLFLSGYYSVGLAAGVSCFMLSLLPALVYGPSVYPQWLTLQEGTFAFRLDWPGNASLIGLGARFGLPWLGTGLVLLLLVGLAFWAWRRKPSWQILSDFGLLASLLASPVAWSGYTLFVLPAFLRRQWSWPWLASALLLLLPWWVSWNHADLSPWHYYLLGSTNAIALLLALAGLGLEAFITHCRGIPAAS